LATLRNSPAAAPGHVPPRRNHGLAIAGGAVGVVAIATASYLLGGAHPSPDRDGHPLGDDGSRQQGAQPPNPIDAGGITVAATTDSPTLPGSTTKGWTEFSSQAGRFKVQMPGTPKAEESTFQSAVGPLVMHMFMAKDNNTNF